MAWFVFDPENGCEFEEFDTIESMREYVDGCRTAYSDDAELNGEWDEHGMPGVRFGWIVGRGGIEEEKTDEGEIIGVGVYEDIVKVSDVQEVLKLISDWTQRTELSLTGALAVARAARKMSDIAQEKAFYTLEGKEV